MENNYYYLDHPNIITYYHNVCPINIIVNNNGEFSVDYNIQTMCFVHIRAPNEPIIILIYINHNDY